jgi:hypothetical protein
VFVYATAGANLVRKVQTSLTPVATKSASGSALPVTGRFDDATGKALTAWADQKSSVWAANVHREIAARKIGPSVMLAVCWLAYAPALQYAEASSAIVPWGRPEFSSVYRPLAWNAAPAEPNEYNRDLFYRWAADEAAPPLRSSAEENARRNADELLRYQEQQRRQSGNTATVLFVIGALALGGWLYYDARHAA